MKIVMKKLSQITPYEQNPRVNDDAVADVAAQMDSPTSHPRGT